MFDYFSIKRMLIRFFQDKKTHISTEYIPPTSTCSIHTLFNITQCYVWLNIVSHCSKPRTVVPRWNIYIG